jgi:hypothetical protein
VEEVVSGLEPILTKPHDTLWHLNLACLQYVTMLLKGSWNYTLSDMYIPKTSEDIVDLRAGVPCGLERTGSHYPAYGQVLRINKPHQSNLSILDALCHLGPGTYDYLNRYASKLYAKS